MKAAYLKAPNQFEIRDVELREPMEDEVILEVKACGFCGHDKILAAYAAEDWQPFGHELCGVVVKLGSGVKRLKPGDRVAVETSIFDPQADVTLNGHPELSMNGPNYMGDPGTALGFAERTVVKEALCVPYDGISDEEACFLEPMGVEADLVLTADIKLGNDVLVMGCGAIGLMALQMAKRSGARKIYVVEHRKNAMKAELALRFGADEVIYTDETDLTKYAFERGGVDRVLVTTPPATIDAATRTCNIGGIVAFLGISYGPAATVSFDSNIVHGRKLQIRGSNAVPALYFPHCIDLVKAGMVEIAPMITHRFALEDAPEGIRAFLRESETAVKAVMLRP